jgi:hypothetical protein
MANTNRVLGRMGARELTPSETEKISGAYWSTSTQRLSHVANHPDVLADSD